MLIIDIGTHKAQELKVLNGKSSYLAFMYFLWWTDWAKRQIKKIILPKRVGSYGIGAYQISPIDFGLNKHMICLSQVILPINYLKNKRILSIDPVAQITSKHLSQLKNIKELIFLPIAILPHDDADQCRLTNFYISKDDLSSSLFSEDRNVSSIVCPAFSFGSVIEKVLEINFIKPEEEVLIRMNCEGSELGVIKELVNRQIVPAGIIGSINDVYKMYGNEVGNNMNKILKNHNINFAYFKGSDPSTWVDAFSVFIKHELRN
jgi:hypothetical protein